MPTFDLNVEAAVVLSGPEVRQGIRTFESGEAHLDPAWLDRWLESESQGLNEFYLGYGKLVESEVEEPGSIEFLDLLGEPIEFPGDSQPLNDPDSETCNCEFAGFTDEIFKEASADGDGRYFEADLFFKVSLVILVDADSEEDAAKLITQNFREDFHFNIDGDLFPVGYISVSGYTPSLAAQVPVCRGCYFVRQPNTQFCSRCGSANLVGM
jgi:hypothetical protein